MSVNCLFVEQHLTVLDR